MALNRHQNTSACVRRQPRHRSLRYRLLALTLTLEQERRARTLDACRIVMLQRQRARRAVSEDELRLVPGHVMRCLHVAGELHGFRPRRRSQYADRWA